ncbi:DUF6204 family protein [Umezawaea tangerina]|uniref:Uncharacterized protein n=1 Tax=Umezawaea tangerina TaxID=84725 RepID=A0A2T0SWJ1_9PSEU|nr:DUF6204 family protein [Umezawaea tangerina]PRY37791.1 hypothetical protein CLV43_10911 [Umezawaea tangerina]
MTEHTYRVLVRGRFTDLDDAGRERLLAEVDRHSLLTNGFSEDGALAYDRTLDFFSYRVQFRAEVRDDERAVRDRGLAMAGRAVDGLGVDYRELRATVTDVDLVKIRQRR